MIGLTVMGLVFLACTGAEALYADLGHFGRRPITTAWLYFVMPALVLNYFGQGALVMADAKAIENPFYRLYPDYALIPMLILSTFATVIASQAVITGAFSLTRQAIQLGLVPRFEIRHTSESIAGQIYMPRVNWLLYVAVLVAIFMFRTSSNLAAAYGVSVTAAMVIDTMMAFFVVWKCWKWPLWRVIMIVVPLLLIEQVLLRGQHPEAARRRLGADLDCGASGYHHVHLGARNEGSRQGDEAQRGRSRLAGAQARSEAAASRAGNGRVPHRRSLRGADIDAPQSEAQQGHARA